MEVLPLLRRQLECASSVLVSAIDYSQGRASTEKRMNPCAVSGQVWFAESRQYMLYEFCGSGVIECPRDVRLLRKGFVPPRCG